MNKLNYLAAALLLLPLVSGCDNSNEQQEGQQEEQQKQDDDAKSDSDAKSDNGTQSDDEAKTDSDAQTEDAQTDEDAQSDTDAQSDEDSNVPACPADDADFTGCLNDGTFDWALVCRDGVVQNSLQCYANEKCYKVGSEIRCLEKVTEALNEYCKIEGNATRSFCQTVGDAVWSIVCEDGELYDGFFGTQNCTEDNMTCVEETGESGTYSVCTDSPN